MQDISYKYFKSTNHQKHLSFFVVKEIKKKK